MYEHFLAFIFLAFVMALISLFAQLASSCSEKLYPIQGESHSTPNVSCEANQNLEFVEYQGASYIKCSCPAES